MIDHACPECGVELSVDLARSRLSASPQVVVGECPSPFCAFTSQRRAPTTSEGGDGRFWRAERASCRVCSRRWVAVFPLGTDEDALECPSCAWPAGEVVEEDRGKSGDGGMRDDDDGGSDEVADGGLIG